MKYSKISLGPWLNDWLQDNKKSSSWLANVMGLSDRQAQKYVHENRTMTLEYIRLVSQATGVDLFVMHLSEESKAIYDRGWALIEEERRALLKKEEETKLEMAERKIQEMQKQMREMQETIQKMGKG